MGIAKRPGCINIENALLKRFLLVSPTECLCKVDDDDEDDFHLHKRGKGDIKGALAELVKLPDLYRSSGSRHKASIFYPCDSSLCEEVADMAFEYCDSRYSANLRKFEVGTASCVEQFKQALNLFCEEAQLNEVVIFVVERPFFVDFFTFLCRNQFHRNIHEKVAGQFDKTFALSAKVLQDGLIGPTNSFCSSFALEGLKKALAENDVKF
ncbi:MAG: hypothetical protein WCI79_01315 [Candidatus Saccharibacteria bacterium]